MQERRVTWLTWHGTVVIAKRHKRDKLHLASFDFLEIALSLRPRCAIQRQSRSPPRTGTLANPSDAEWPVPTTATRILPTTT